MKGNQNCINALDITCDNVELHYHTFAPATIHFDDNVTRAFASLRALLRDVACSGVEFDDIRVGYVVVQIDRATWDAVQKVRQG